MEYTGHNPSIDDVLAKIKKEYGANHTVGAAMHDRLCKACALTDEIVPELDDGKVEICVDKPENRLRIIILCEDVIFEHGRTHKFFDLIKFVDSFSFSKRKNDCLQITLNFDGLWEDASE